MNYRVRFLTERLADEFHAYAECPPWVILCDVRSYLIPIPQIQESSDGVGGIELLVVGVSRSEERGGNSSPSMSQRRGPFKAAEQHVKCDGESSFEPAPAGYSGPCLLEVVPEWRSGRGRFYRPDAQGYTDRPAMAGVWVGEAAFDRAMPGKCYPVPVATVVDAILDAVTRLREKMQ